MSIKKKSVLVIIPARAKSRRLPNKNLKPFCGKPLIAWSIEAAKGCRFVDAIAVSTESRKIANVAKAWGGDVPFLRPGRLATDKASTLDVLFHVMSFFEQRSRKFDILVLLQPTSPLRSSRHLSEALALFINKRANAVVSVEKSPHPPQWTKPLTGDLGMRNFCEIKRPLSQNAYWRLNGAIYIARWDFLRKQKGWYSKRTYAYVMDRTDSVDVDTIEDFWIAELFMKKKMRNRH